MFIINLYKYMIKVFGHMAPDTDATGSAILMTWYLNNFTTHKSEAFVLGPLNKETQFVLNKWGIKEPELLEKVEKGDQVVIVDTNNPQELFPNINETEILYIVDHHKLIGGLKSETPMDVFMKPFASTASVIYSLITENGRNNEARMFDNEGSIAGLMLSCILSDTLCFRSPTTTPHDKDLAERLAKELGIDIEKYSMEMFDAKSDVSDFTDHGLIHMDSKKFEVGDKSFRVSVVETTNPKMIFDRFPGVASEIEKIKDEEKEIEDVLFFVVDILNEEATVLVQNDYVRRMLGTSFGVSIAEDEGTKVLPGVVSRKKQIVPSLKLPN